MTNILLWSDECAGCVQRDIKICADIIVEGKNSNIQVSPTQQASQAHAAYTLNCLMNALAPPSATSATRTRTRARFSRCCGPAPSRGNMCDMGARFLTLISCHRCVSQSLFPPPSPFPPHPLPSYAVLHASSTLARARAL